MAYLCHVSLIVLKLRELREQAGLTQVELAEMVGVDQTYISRLELNKRRTIGFDLLGRLCEALDCEPGDLLKREGKRGKRRGRSGG